MPCVAYKKFRFSNDTKALIEKTNEILAEYEEQGLDLTLRQVYYQFVARGLIPNKDSEYKRLGSVINDARLAGLIDWNHIVDRTRFLRSVSHWDAPSDIVASAAQSFRLDKWEDQRRRVECWIEKDALIGVIDGVCREHDIGFFSCRGYVSQSEMWGAAQRHIKYNEAGQEVIVLHLGDHDPSGVDMSRDIAERLTMFGADTRVERIALTMAQVQQHNPPPNPAKLTDSRCRDYIEKYGEESWELDALEPRLLIALVRLHIKLYLNEKDFETAQKKEAAHRQTLSRASESWADVQTFLKKPRKKS